MSGLFRSGDSLLGMPDDNVSQRSNLFPEQQVRVIKKDRFPPIQQWYRTHGRYGTTVQYILDKRQSWANL